MDPIRNPYSPGAGTPPPELAGRDDLRGQVRIALERVRAGRSAKSVLMVGLRGVGKTVLLWRMSQDALATGHLVLHAEAPEGRSLPSLLAPRLRQALLKLSRIERARSLAGRALRGLAGFVCALKVKYQDLEVALDVDAEPGLADSGILEEDLFDLLQVTGHACREAGTALVMFVDEMQYVPEEQLEALIVSLHGVMQHQLPVVLVGAGLPQLRAQAGRAKSYAERLFDYPEVGALSDVDARFALEKPALVEGVAFEGAALDRLLSVTQRYPYFLQEWGRHVWDVAQASPIRESDVEAATDTAIAGLDQGFFLVRFDRMTPAEKRYMRAMAALGPGPHRSGDIARILDRKVESLAPLRNNLISKGMIWSPSHGDTAFTVPLFDQFMKRIMPEL